MLYSGRYHISSVFAFTCGRAKTIRIRYVWTRIFSKTKKKTSVFKNIRIRVDRALGNFWQITAAIRLIWIWMLSAFFYSACICIVKSLCLEYVWVLFIYVKTMWPYHMRTSCDVTTVIVRMSHVNHMWFYLTLYLVLVEIHSCRVVFSRKLKECKSWTHIANVGSNYWQVLVNNLSVWNGISTR